MRNARWSLRLFTDASGKGRADLIQDQFESTENESRGSDESSPSGKELDQSALPEDAGPSFPTRSRFGTLEAISPRDRNSKKRALRELLIFLILSLIPLPGFLFPNKWYVYVAAGFALFLTIGYLAVRQPKKNK